MPFFKTPEKSTRSKVLQNIKASGFKSTVKYKTPDCFLAIDDEKKLWFVLDEQHPSKCKVHSYSDIVDVEILKDQQTVIKSSAGSEIGRGIFGGMLFGGVGAIVGGNSAKQTTSTQLTQLGVRLIINDVKEPMVYINCIHARDQVESIYGSFLAIYKSNHQ